MKKPAYFQMYLDNYEALQCLSEAQVGRLVMAVYAYAIKETEPDFTDDPALQVTFAFIRRNIDREFESYSKKCERNQRNVMNRCESTSNVASRNESIPNVTSRNESLEEEKEKEEEKEEEHSLSARVVTQFHEICDELPKVKKHRHICPVRILQICSVKWRVRTSCAAEAANGGRTLTGSYDPIISRGFWKGALITAALHRKW